jgi:hypothetical protein
VIGVLSIFVPRRSGVPPDLEIENPQSLVTALPLQMLMMAEADKLVALLNGINHKALAIASKDSALKKRILDTL